MSIRAVGIFRASGIPLDNSPALEIKLNPRWSLLWKQLQGWTARVVLRRRRRHHRRRHRRRRRRFCHELAQSLNVEDKIGTRSENTWWVKLSSSRILTHARWNKPGLRLKGTGLILGSQSISPRLDEPDFLKAHCRLKLEVSSFYEGKARHRRRLEGIFHRGILAQQSST